MEQRTDTSQAVCVCVCPCKKLAGMQVHADAFTKVMFFWEVSVAFFSPSLVWITTLCSTQSKSWWCGCLAISASRFWLSTFCTVQRSARCLNIEPLHLAHVAHTHCAFRATSFLLYTTRQRLISVFFLFGLFFTSSFNPQRFPRWMQRPSHLTDWVPLLPS